MTTWRNVVGAVDPARFARRLQWDGLDEGGARSMLDARTATPSREASPPWLGTLIEAYGWADDSAPCTFDPATWPGVADPTEPLPFEALLLPLIELARQRVHEAAPDALRVVTPDALGSVLRGLLRRLTSTSAVALFAEFSVYRASHPGIGLEFLVGDHAAGSSDLAYRGFTSSLLGDRLVTFFERYPVAARLCGTVTNLWVEAVTEFFVRLQVDAPDIASTFCDGHALGHVASVQANAGDTHAGGRSVFVVRFSEGLTVVYKPRPIPLEVCFTSLVAWVNHQKCELDLRTPKLLSRPTHGWIEFIAFESCPDRAAASRYYHRSGKLLALVYALNGTDFHLENLIAAGEHPMLIDMEALLGHRCKTQEMAWTLPASLRDAREMLNQSVLRTCLLPGQYIGRNGATDIGGLAAASEAAERIAVAKWHDVNRDAMRFEHSTADAPADEGMKNLPAVDGATLSGSEFVEEIASGFRTTYRILQRGRAELLGAAGPLLSMQKQPVRFLFRHTNLYATLLGRTLHPAYLRDGIERGIELEALAQPLLASEQRPASWPLFHSEIRALEQLDVPLFTAHADSCSIHLDTGEDIDCFEENALHQVSRRLDAMCEADQERQLYFIRTSFVAAGGRGLMVGGDACVARRPLQLTGIATARELSDEANNLATRVMNAAFIRGPDGPAWVGIGYVPFARRYAVGAVPLALFDGCAGIALFLAAADHLDANPELRDTATQLARMILGDLRNIDRIQRVVRSLDLGAGTGVGGVLRASVSLSRWLEMPELLEAAREAAVALSPAIIGADTNYGVLSGSAGAIVGLLALHEATGDPAVLEQARRCGQHLVDRRRPHRTTRLRGWPTWEGRPETGLAQGLGGIASALQQLANATSHAEFESAADEAIRLERSMVGIETENSSVAASWCTGTIGRGAARLCNPGISSDAISLAEVELAITAASTSLDMGADTLCTGAMGRVDFLLHAAAVLDRPDLRETARQAGTAILRRSRDKGGWETPWGQRRVDAGFFHGLSGIGYQCLRLAEPDRIPSVLHWSLGRSAVGAWRLATATSVAASAFEGSVGVS